MKELQQQKIYNPDLPKKTCEHHRSALIDGKGDMTFVLACVGAGFIEFPKNVQAEIKARASKLAADLQELSKRDPELPKHVCAAALSKPEYDVAFVVACKAFAAN